MSAEISIQQMTLADKPAVLDFLKKAYPDNPRHGDSDFWDWHFTDAPYIRKDNLPIWLAKSGDRLAGQLATLPVELNVQGEKVQALWVLDWIVDEDFRRRGIGKKLALGCRGVFALHAWREPAAPQTSIPNLKIRSRHECIRYWLISGCAELGDQGSGG